MTIKYCIHKTVPAIEMRLEPPHPHHSFDEPFLSSRIEFDHSKYLYLVDILERKPEHHTWAKMRIYMPDGRVATGWQSTFFLNLYIINSSPPPNQHRGRDERLFDGRFNLTLEEATAMAKRREMMKNKPEEKNHAIISIH